MPVFTLFSRIRVENQETAEQESTGLTPEPSHFEKNLRATRRIRVVIADDHPVMRNGLSEIVSKQEDMEIIGQAANGEEAVETTLKVKPDVVLMDVVMPVLDGVAATRKITAERPEICVIGLTLYEDYSVVHQMRLAGASQCLTKSCPTEMLLAAIRSCMHF